MKTFRVDLGPRSYEIHVGAGLLDDVDSLLPKLTDAEKTAIVADRNVDDLYGEAVEKALAAGGPVVRLTVEPGEPSKSIGVAAHLLDELAARKMRRDDRLVTLGGGMVGDLGGFVASIYQRGMPLVHLPTTLLAQVDAAVGGKTAVNLGAGKNLAGTFYQPSAVVADVGSLRTLPEREFRSGLAEVAKYGFILATDLLELLEDSLDLVLARDSAVLEEIVGRCVEVKARLVGEDEMDRGERLLLNYGHTFAHALEALSDYREWHHGDAVAVGMVFAAVLAADVGYLDSASVDRHVLILGRLGLPTSAEFDPDEIIERWSIDKKYRAGQRWVLLKGIGEAVVETGLDEALVRRALLKVMST